MARILLIDDDPDLSQFLQLALEERGHMVEHLERAERGPDALAEGDFDVVLLDNKMPGMSGIDFLEALQQRDLRIPVILMTGHTTTDTAIRAMNLGAFDYVIKPIDYQELLGELESAIGEALRISRPPPDVLVQREASAEDPAAVVMLGNSRPVLDVCKQIGKFARRDDAVLVLGETGTGKELVARAIHQHSRRAGGPFLAINCAAIAETLLESELFGHEKDAFTGAAKLRKGKFEHAHGGTLFLDEIGDMPVALQAKLLRVLQEREVNRIGGNEVIKVDVRVISATNRDLEVAIRAGTFRQDLYYRLKGLRISLPPLRERGLDLGLLARYFIARAAKNAGTPPPALPESTLARLREHSWPGNIRELQNVMHAAVVMCRGPQILPEHLDLGVPASAAAEPDESAALTGLHRAIGWAWATGQPKLFSLLHDLLERELLCFALAETGGNQTQTADRIGMSRGTVIARMQKYSLKG